MKRNGFALMAWMFIAGGVALWADEPSAVLRDALLVKFPAETDSNSPVHWDGDTFYLFNSMGKPKRSSGPDLVHLGTAIDCPYNTKMNGYGTTSFVAAGARSPLA